MPVAGTRRPTFGLMLGSTGLVLLLATGVALAATLGVSSTKLTTSTGASTITPTSCTLSAADADSYVDQVVSAANFGTLTTLDVRSSSSTAQRTFVRIDIAACPVPANALITAANLKLFLYSAPANPRTYDAHRVSGSWTETGITWTNQPSVSDAAATSTATGSSSNVTLTWDVKADVQAYVDGTANNGWRLKDRSETGPARTGQFRSAEYGTAAQRPILEITYYP